ncbi:MAG: sulfotransferase [Xanthomonadales bacterium]|nr:sulfotransferase [Xanthomonadales bacterium]
MKPGAPGQARQAVRVPAGLHRQSRFFAATVGLWRRLGDLESAVLRELTEPLPIDRPIYVTSLPRSGTTIVTELLDQHPELTSHRYSDFPNVWTPYWRNYLLQRTRRRAPEKVERAHRDRIRVSNDSPEAVEELLWMHFFPRVHAPGEKQVLEAADRNPEFDAFYADAIRKLLAVRNARRYLAKGNYNVARIGYILSLFPDARLLVPVRRPVDHIASLMKQHELFTRDSREDPRIPLQLALSGHFEFGPGRRFVHFGDRAESDAIANAWSGGREVEGWARYWAATYRHLLEGIEQDAGRGRACLVFSYEALCADSESMIDRILAHCELPSTGFENTRQRFARNLSLPDYYEPQFTDGERELIHDHCSEVFDRLGALFPRTV